MGNDVSVEGGQYTPQQLQQHQQQAGYVSFLFFLFFFVFLFFLLLLLSLRLVKGTTAMLGNWFGGPQGPQGGGGGQPNQRLQINVGQEVEAQYDEDSLWYRAKITKFESGNKIQVDRVVCAWSVFPSLSLFFFLFLFFLSLQVRFTQYDNIQWCGMGQLRPIVPYTEGMQVEARYDEDEKWYPFFCFFVSFCFFFVFFPLFRYGAKILKRMGPDAFTVVFTEYGNQQTCDRSILRPLEKEINKAISAEIARQSVRM
jgi:hypothetical protein